MKTSVLSCSYWTWVLHSIPLIMICYCQGCENTSAYVILPSIGLDHICHNDNSLCWLMVWNLKWFLCRVEYHKDRFWVLFFFTIYPLPLGDIIRKHGLKFHMYADDCQFYTSFSMSTNEAVSSMQMAIDDIRAWYAANMLKLNDDKTEMLVIGSKYRTIPKLPDLNVRSTVITPLAS